MSLRAGMLGVVVLAALAARAGEQGAPLEKSKEDLKALQKDQGAPRGAGALGELREAMPAIQSPVTASLPTEANPRQNSEAELKKKKEAQKNWLLEGMDKLDKNPRTKGAAKGDLTATEGEHGQADPNEPASLLNLYSEQQKNDEARDAAKQSKAVHTDPLAPFLQGWLADSPVRGKFFDEYVRKPDGLTVPGGTAAAAGPENTSGPGLPDAAAGGLGSRNGPAGAPTVQANPYLQGFDSNMLQDAGSGNRQSAAIPMLQSAGIPPPGNVAEPVPALRPSDKKQPLPAVPDDKKYFPQLKKF